MPLDNTEDIRQTYCIIFSVEKMEIFPKYVVAIAVVVCVDLLPTVNTGEIRQTYWIIASVEKMEIFPKFVVVIAVVLYVDLKWFVAYYKH